VAEAIEAKFKKAEYQSKLAGLVTSKFQEAQDFRRPQEERWITAYHNFRGIYGKTVKFRDSEKSRVFVKITKTKVIAAFGQLVDVVFGTNQFPIGISETKVPEGVSTFAHLKSEAPGIETSTSAPVEAMQLKTEKLRYDVGYNGDGQLLKPGATLSPEESTVAKINASENVELIDGPTADPETPEIRPARDAARLMQKLIHDQIEETDGTTELRSSLFESALFGTGIIKGPFNFNKTIHKWTLNEDTQEREYVPITTRVPRSEFVSVWDFFPDPNGTTVDDCEYIIDRHRYSAKQVRALKNLPHFKEDKILECLANGPNYTDDGKERELRDDASSQGSSSLYEVLEYWGVMDTAACIEAGITPPNLDTLQDIQVNAWVCNGLVLRAVLNPFTPARIPYSAFPYERNPYSLFGIGVAENMDDSQQIMNGHVRMAIDNMALSGNVVFDVDTSMLEAGQDLEVYPGKVFRRQGGMPGTAVNAITFPNTTNANLQVFDKFRQLADEQTGIASYSHGMTGIQSTGRTASGMSMLMNASSLNIKTVVKNLDDFLLKPLGKAYYHWNMQFFEGPLDIRGDLEVKAMGTTSLMQKEVRSQRLTTVLQTVANPALAPYVKINTLLSELAVSLELDPEEFINDPEQVRIAAEIIGMQNAPNQQGNPSGPQGAQGQPPMAQPQGPAPVSEGALPQDTSGGAIGGNDVQIAG
jgi:hypothetical protein